MNATKTTKATETKAKELAREVGINPNLGWLLIRRGINTVSEAKRFFRPQLNELHDPFLFRDMEKAVNRLNDALGRKERILVYGDYDVDGIFYKELYFDTIFRVYGYPEESFTDVEKLIEWLYQYDQNSIVDYDDDIISRNPAFCFQKEIFFDLVLREPAEPLRF